MCVIGTHIGDGIRKTWVAESEPATWGDAVCLVLELFGVHLEEVLEARGETDGAVSSLTEGIGYLYMKENQGTKSRVENKHYSVMYFDRIRVFKALYL